MSGLRVLLTNITLASRTGTETYVRDLALVLAGRGESPAVYSPELGPIADEIRAAGVPVVTDLAALGDPPDVVHGHHHPTTMEALLHFPAAAGIFVCHSFGGWQDAPPDFPRVRRFVAVDDACLERLLAAKVPSARTLVLPNAVDTSRFRPRGPLPPAPRRALVFSNRASDANYLPAVREACARTGLALAVIGEEAGALAAAPERRLGDYDVVFAKARCALEAMATGAAVVLCDTKGAGPLVTTAELDRLRRLNFGFRTLVPPVTADALVREIRRYDPRDAAEVSRRLREEASLDRLADDWRVLYREVLAEQRAATPDPCGELRAAADYVRGLARLGWRTEHAEDVSRALREQERVLVETIRTLERLPSVRFARRLRAGLPIRALLRAIAPRPPRP